MCLQGHRSGVLDLAFDGSDKTPVNHIVTVSKDATVRLWDINVRYIVHEDPKVLKSFTGKDKKPFQAGDISPNGKLFALAREKELVFISTIDTKEILVVQNALDGKYE
jgi:WD40 repeat protein